MSKDKSIYPICNTCKTERKPVKFNGKMKRICDCGVFEKDGTIIIDYSKE